VTPCPARGDKLPTPFQGAEASFSVSGLLFAHATTATATAGWTTAITADLIVRCRQMVPPSRVLPALGTCPQQVE
jgi:hypothetical protein